MERVTIEGLRIKVGIGGEKIRWASFTSAGGFVVFTIDDNGQEKRYTSSPSSSEVLSISLPDETSIPESRRAAVLGVNIPR